MMEREQTRPKRATRPGAGPQGDGTTHPDGAGQPAGGATRPGGGQSSAPLAAGRAAPGGAGQPVGAAVRPSGGEPDGAGQPAGGATRPGGREPAGTSRHSRIDALRSGLGKMDAFFVNTYENRRYYSGFSGSNGYLVISPIRSILVTDQRYGAQAAAEAPEFEILVHGIDPIPTLVDAIAQGAGGPGAGDSRSRKPRIGYESKGISDFQISSLRESCASVDWVPTTDVGLAQRAVKDAGEIALIREACRIADAAWEATLPTIRPGVTERRVAAELEYNLAKLGSERPAFPTIVATGVNSALPHAEPSERRIEEGHIVTVDFGAVVGGYHSDLTRCAVIGRPPALLRRILELTEEALRAAIDALRVGARCMDIDAVPRRIFVEADLEQYSLRGLGHGVGLQIHELPRVVMDNEDVLSADMVFTIEPGLYIPDLGGVRLEETVHLAADGRVGTPICLTKSERVARIGTTCTNQASGG
jgi:Xaa-Pro aminopeptidase